MQNGVNGKRKNGDEKKTIQAVVEAVTEKYGGGVKLDGVFYNLAGGLELPEKGGEIVAVIQGKNVVKWWEVVGEGEGEGDKDGEGRGEGERRGERKRKVEREQEHGGEQEEPGAQGQARTFELADDIKIKVPENVRAAADTFLAILKYLDEMAPSMWSKDKIIVASVIFKEIMETKRAKLLHKTE